jgi:uncharacterized membrane protein YesL
MNNNENNQPDFDEYQEGRETYEQTVIYRYSEVILTIIKLTAIWLLFNIFPILLMIFLNPTILNLPFYFIGLLWITFFTQPIYNISRSNKKVFSSQIFKYYLNALKQDIKGNLLWSIIFTFTVVVLITDIIYNSGNNLKNIRLQRTIFFILLLLILGLFSYIFSIQNNFKFKLKDIYKLSISYFLINFKGSLKNFAIFFVITATAYYFSAYSILFLIPAGIYFSVRNILPALIAIRELYTK